MKSFRAGASGSLGAICRAYAAIIFSSCPWAGAFILAATFLSPWHGLTGVCGAVIAMTTARVAGFDRSAFADGRLLYNSAMASLVLACWFPPGAMPAPAFALLLVLVSIAALGLTLILNNIAVIVAGTSAMSLPFWVAATALHWFLAQKGFAWGAAVRPDFAGWPEAVRIWFQSVGVISFTSHEAAGLMVTLAILWTSRLHLLHAVAGFATAWSVLSTIGFPLEDCAWVYLSCMFTAVALGGVFYVPSRSAFLLAMAGAALCAFVGMALLRVLQLFDAPLLTLPFNLTTLGIVAAMRWRPRFDTPRPVVIPARNPETACRATQLYDARLPDPLLPAIAAPFDGEWVITQGFDGGLTHAGPWRHALDFEIADSHGRPARPESANLVDFPSFGAPVLSPVTGRIVRVVSDVSDNPVGDTNLSENWGNTIVIEVTPDLFVQLSHFRQRSVSVREGERVRQGQLLGYLGNSGRSPVPHLHLQVQRHPEIGSATIPFRLRGYRTRNHGGGWTFHFRGLPPEGSSLAGCRPARWIEEDIPAFFAVGSVRSYRVFSARGESREQVRFSMAADGSLLLESGGSKLRMIVADHCLIPSERAGRSSRVLGALWLAGRIPLIGMPEVEWTESADPTFGLGPFQRVVGDCVAPFLPKVPPAIHGKVAAADRKSGEFSTSHTNDRNLLLELGFRAGSFLVAGRTETPGSWMNFIVVPPGEPAAERHGHGASGVSLPCLNSARAALPA